MRRSGLASWRAIPTSWKASVVHRVFVCTPDEVFSARKALENVLK